MKVDYFENVFLLWDVFFVLIGVVGGIGRFEYVGVEFIFEKCMFV